MGLKFWGDSKEHAVTSLDRPSRITNMNTPDLRDWMDLEIMHLGQAFDQWRYHSHGSVEVTTRLDNLSMMWDELAERK
jgi:hypothetical protein|tara:strand:- start:204 stop:437 length:234 start_codon:yes stop_codon:yes gene_type:complete